MKRVPPSPSLKRKSAVPLPYPDTSSSPLVTSRTLQTFGSASGNKDVGFLGSTAFNAVFSDNRVHIPTPSPNRFDASNGSQLHVQITASWRKTPYRNNQDAAFVLDLVKEAPHLDKIIDRCAPEGLAWSIIGPWVKDIQKSVKEDILDRYDLADSEAQTAVIESLSANTESPFTLPHDVRFRDFASYYTGHRLCWEAVGIFLTACGLSLLSLSCDADELEFAGKSEHPKQRLMFRLLEASDICVSLCNEANTGTDLGFWLMIDNCIHASQVLGDAHYAVWRKLGDISTAVFARGLHEDTETAEQAFWLKEVRRRALAQAYGMDKMLSTFVGRPPRISKRYCNVRIPLDLEYMELALEGEALAELRSSLDAAGWKTRETWIKDKRPASVRIYALGALIREETLELCLGPSPDRVREKAQNVIDKSKELYASYPPWLQYSPGKSGDQAPKPSFVAIEKYLDNVYNEFMIRRVLVRHARDNPTELVLIAHNILEAVIEARNLRGLVQSGAGVPWVIVLYGLPAAGVLALELLQLNVQAVSHAKIKQNLCVFISFLKWVHIPGEGNYALALRGCETLQHIMDKVLAADSHVSAVADASEPNAVGLGDDLGVFDFSWLDQGHFDQNLWDGLNSIV